MQLETIRLLLMPADAGRPSMFIQADDRWRFPDVIPEDTQAVLWGRPPLLSSRPWLAVTRAALARERALRRLRLNPPKRFPIATIHRLPPLSMRAPSVRTRLSAALRSGALVELTTAHRSPRVIDRIAEAAGATNRLKAFTRGAGGALLFRILRSDGAGLILRCGRHLAPDDPAHGAKALDLLRDSGLAVVPTLIGRGQTNGASWTVETTLPGKRPSRLSPQLAKQVVALCAQFPRSSGPPRAVVSHIAAIARHMPQRVEELTVISEKVADALSFLPGVLCHGDLWTSNLLVQGDRLSGLVDWDSWHEDGVPGTDPLNLVAVQMQVAARREIGEIWLERPWRSSSFTDVMTGYWEAFGVRPTPEALDALGLAWWAARMAAILSRNPNVLAVDGWARQNIDRVVSAAMHR
jgi:aminoglycoside phosphotransferase